MIAISKKNSNKNKQNQNNIINNSNTINKNKKDTLKKLIKFKRKNIE